MIVFLIPLLYITLAASASHALPEVDYKALSQQQTVSAPKEQE
jgi:hypothetical protein